MATSVELLATMDDLADAEFKKFKWFLQQAEALEGFPEIPKSRLEAADRMDTVDELTETYDKKAVEVTIKVLKIINKNDLVQRLLNINPMSKETLNDCHRKLKSTMKNKFKHMFTQEPKSGKQMLMNEIYTDLSVMDETLERTIDIGGVFESTPGQDGSIRTLMTKGVSGIGKTVLTQKFGLDWAEDKVNNGVQFIFTFTFRELNLLKDRKYSWVELLHHTFTDLREAGISRFDKLTIVFILDGLDESHFPLDFQNNEILTDVTDSASVDVLLTNLIMGKLFPSTYVWITTTPEAAGRIPSGYIDMVTEARGFIDPKKEEYFRKRFRNKELAKRVIAHIKGSQSLHIMCHVPIFCWITAGVLEDLLKSSNTVLLPKTMTEMYLHFLLRLSKPANVTYHGRAETYPVWNIETRKIILSLGKLAFEQLQKRNLIFHEADLRECGTDLRAITAFSGIFKEDIGLNKDTLFCFVHLSFQEFLAAVYVFVSFINSGVNVLSEAESASPQSLPITEPLLVKQLFQDAIDKALGSPHGHLSLFLRFLVGLSLQNNQELLQDLLKQSGSSFQSNQDTARYIREKIREDPDPERCMNLFHCLNELKDLSLEEEIQQYLSPQNLSADKLSPTQWSALVHILLSSEKKVDVFNLKKASPSEEGLLWLLPVVRASRVSLLSGCGLSWRSGKVLASALSSISSNLRELDLSHNNVTDEGFKDLTQGLMNPQSRMETLRLSGCSLTSKSCGFLSPVLSLKTSSLKDLDLSNNRLEDTGVELLSVGLANQHCRVETLRLGHCSLTWKGCDAVAFFVNSKTSRLTKLDLTMNQLQDSGVLVFSAGLESPHCKLESLSLRACDLSGKSCEALASVFSLQTSTLRELDLNNNNLEDSDVMLLSAGLESPHCTLDTLRLSLCNLSERSCAGLASVLRSQTSCLKELDLSSNDLQDSGAKLLSAGLESPLCKLESLRLSGCFLSEGGCSSLASALSLNPSHLRELDLSYNHPGDSAAKLLSAGLEDPQWRLETLKLDHGGGQRLKPGLWKYACDLTFDPNTAHRQLILSDDNRQVKYVAEQQTYRYHPERFDCFTQLLCREGLTGRCYWEMETVGRFYVALTYRGISRRGAGQECRFGGSDKCWSLYCENGYCLWHNNTLTQIDTQSDDNFSKIAAYLDWQAGSLSFYGVSTKKLTHIYTVHSTFDEPLYPGVGFVFRCYPGLTTYTLGSSLSLSRIDEDKTSVRHPAPDCQTKQVFTFRYEI